MHSLLFFNLLTATQQMELGTHSCVATHSLSFTWLALCAHAHQISAEAPHPPSKTTLNASDQVRVLINNPYTCLVYVHAHARTCVYWGGGGHGVSHENIICPETLHTQRPLWDMGGTAPE